VKHGAFSTTTDNQHRVSHSGHVSYPGKTHWTPTRNASVICKISNYFIE
jgi:hypothetical protein